jgi:energy-coupling factor transporter ATP-binding protein EcfA2
VYLKSLTLRGFKSFASSTTLELEPGITCVVGPNGSGKSNVVDALAWVMGEQGAKSLRGGKMEDVIFAGTSGRPPLGRAEVVLTIDNTDGALPIEYSEVTISRTMFRNGGSEYAINGTSCRLLDVQELLSDSGIGREMHVIVGQGQLDSVLRATPEDRRGFVEEAAGVLKHRKRKEKALRKLDATQGNLTRLQDVLTELRRQLKPLGRQAEAHDRRWQQTLTGFKWLGKIGDLAFGYEEALGYSVAPHVARDKDGVSAILAVLELAAELKAEGRTLLDLLDDLYREHGLHATGQLSVRVDDLSIIADAMSTLRTTPPRLLGGLEVTAVDDLADGYAGLPPTDGIRLALALPPATEAAPHGPAIDSARIICRPSGTEPKLKCYIEVVVSVQDSVEVSREQADATLEALRSDLATALGLA